MRVIVQYIRHALRSLRRTPAFTLTIVATLAIGIGLNTAIFTVVDCVLLRPLGYRDADRIEAIQTRFIDQNRSIFRIAGDNFRDLATQVKGIEAAAYYSAGSDGIRLNGNAIYLPVASVSPAFGQVMGVQPVAGRLFGPADTSASEALVSAAFAREHFGSARDAVGKVIDSSGLPRPIVGVLPEGFSFPEKTSVWMERGQYPEIPNRSAFNGQAIVKRRAGVTPKQLVAELAQFSANLQRAYLVDRYQAIEAVPLQDEVVGEVRPTLRLLMGAVGVVLLIVFANVAHLQLVRATRQFRTITIHTALGASKLTVACRFLLEALLLAIAGGVGALLFAVPALRALIFLAPPNTPRLADIHLNFQVLFFSFLVSVVVMSCTAVLPVWRSWHIDPASALRQESSRGMDGSGGKRLRNGLLIAEIGLTLTLSIAAMMLTRELIRQSHEDLGFEADHLITLDVHVPPAAPPPTEAQVSAATPAQVKAYDRQQERQKLAQANALIASVAHLPGVDSVGTICGAPIGFDCSDVSYAVRGRQVFGPPFKGLYEADVRIGGSNVFDVLHVPVLRGRGLTSEDRADAPKILVINQVLARQIFPNQDPVGQQIMCGLDEESTWWTIVGVVGDVRGESPALAPRPTLYVPLTQHPWALVMTQLLVRTHADPSALIPTLLTRLKQTHPEIAVRAATMRDSIGEAQHADRFRSFLFGSFAGVSVLLAIVGIYGVTAYNAAQRSFEFSLRVAVGAGKMQLLAMVFRQVLSLALVGITLGVSLSFALVKIVSSTTHVASFDGAAFIFPSLGILLLTLIAAAVPASSAANADPMSILRSE